MQFCNIYQQVFSSDLRSKQTSIIVEPVAIINNDDLKYNNLQRCIKETLNPELRSLFNAFIPENFKSNPGLKLKLDHHLDEICNGICEDVGKYVDKTEFANDLTTKNKSPNRKHSREGSEIHTIYIAILSAFGAYVSSLGGINQPNLITF
jgi:hypothetical protein